MGGSEMRYLIAGMFLVTCALHFFEAIEYAENRRIEAWIKERQDVLDKCVQSAEEQESVDNN
jgi:hypothetical protein